MLVLDVYTWIRFGVWLAIGKSVGSEFFIVVDLKSSISWYVVACRPLKISQAKQKAVMKQVYFMPVSYQLVCETHLTFQKNISLPSSGSEEKSRNKPS
jgi:hypothetical protein